MIATHVLVGFVTTSDPTSRGGSAGILTVAKATPPQIAYLLYTEVTRPNREALERWMGSPTNEDLANVQRFPVLLDLQDITDYEALTHALTQQLERIVRKHPAAHLHLVSGLPQARLIFALYLSATGAPGTLWEVNPPGPQSPTLSPLEPQPLDRDDCASRLERWPVPIFRRFHLIHARRREGARLVFEVSAGRVRQDAHEFDLRPRKTADTAAGEHPRRAFNALLMLTARKLWGPENNDWLDRKTLRDVIYHDVSDPTKVPNSLARINTQALNIARRSKCQPPLMSLVEIQQDRYRLTDQAAMLVDFRDPEAVIPTLQRLLQDKKPYKLEHLFPNLA